MNRSITQGAKEQRKDPKNINTISMIFSSLNFPEISGGAVTLAQ